MTVRPTTLNLEAVIRAPEGSVLTYGDSDWAGDADRFSVSAGQTLGWYPITASSKKQPTIALNSGEAELVAALSGACEGMGLRQQWHWFLKFECNAEETNETTQQVLCCDSSAALGVTKRTGSTRETKHIEVLLVTLERATRSETCPREDVFDEDTVDIKFGPSLETRIGDQIRSWTDLNLVETIERRMGVEIPLLFSTFFLVLCGTHNTFYNELRVDVFLVHAVCFCSAILVTRHMSNCGQTPAVPELD